MSLIINNKNLLDKLYKVGQQAQYGVSGDPTLNFSVLDSLISNLESNINSFNTFTSARDNTEIFVKDLENTYNFLHYLARNQVRDSGNYILSIPHISNELDKETKWMQQNNVLNQYVKYPKPTDDNSDDFRFWVHKNGVISFINTLENQSQNKSNGGDLLRVMLDKLSNEIVENSGQAIDPKDKTQTSGIDLNPEWVLDSIPKTIDLNKPDESGNLQLKVKDLSSPGSFNGWVGSNRPNILENGKTEELANKQNICKLISYLQNRAQNYKQFDNKSNPQTTALVNYYVNQINMISKQNSCAVDSAKTDKDKTKEKDRKDSGDGSGNLNLDNLIRVLPLRTDVINLARISNFFNYAQSNLLESNEAGDYRTKFKQIGSNVASLKTKIDEMVNDQYQQSANNFSLSSSPNDVVGMLAPNYRRYNEFLYTYIQIVQQTANAVSLLLQLYEDKISDANLYYLKAQVGWGGSEASSIAQQNIAKLTSLSNNANQAIRQTQTESPSRGAR